MTLNYIWVAFIVIAFAVATCRLIFFHDTDVFTDVQIDPLGELTYKVVPSPDVTEKTFMNVIFKVKD